MAFHFLCDSERLQIYFHTGPRPKLFGLEVESGGRYIIAISSPLITKGVASLESIGARECEAFTESDPAVSLQHAQEAHPGPIHAALPLLPGHLFLVPHLPQSQFHVVVDSSHPIITQQKPDTYPVIPFTTQYADLSTNATIPCWTPGPSFTLGLHIRGPLPVPAFPFAIDFGTTSTCAAFLAGKPPRPKLFMFQGHESVPTLLAYDDIGANGGRRKFKLGHEAFEHQGFESKARGMKRWLGREGVDGSHQVFIKNHQHNVPAEEAYFDFVDAYRNAFQDWGQVRLQRVKATYPPDYPPRALQSMRFIYGERMKIDPDYLFGIDEASAAAVFYVWQRLEKCGFNAAKYQADYGETHNLLVFDLGGGTTDVSLVEVTAKSQVVQGHIKDQVQLKVLGTASLLNIGGDNFTLEVLKAVKCRIALAAALYYGEGAHGEPPPTVPADVQAALHELYSGRERFNAFLDPQRPSADPTAGRDLEELAERVIATRWKRFQGAHGNMFARKSALEQFEDLWIHAEQYKVELCTSGTARLKASDFAGQRAHGISTLVPPEVLDKITLDRDVDLYRRIRPMVRKAVRACRLVTISPEGMQRSIHSIQLVGNSCKIDLVREVMIEEFQPVLPMVKGLIEFEPRFAKAAVALGACLASWRDFGVPTRPEISFIGIGDELGYEIGQYNPPHQPFTPLFRPSDRPSSKPWVDLPATDRISLDLYRRRPGQDDAEIESLGSFLLTETPEMAGIAPVPHGKFRLFLLGPEKLKLIKGQSAWSLMKPRQRVDPMDDPFSGVH
jgi:hypothetical protein